MSLRTLLPLLLAALLANGALAAPVDAPPVPDVPLGPVAIDGPPAAPPVAAPPITLTLPSRPERPGIGAAFKRPDPLPVPALPAAIPDLVGKVVLPGVAARVFGLAPPFGGSSGAPSSEPSAPIPEPGTAALLALGLGALAVTRRR